MERKSFRTCTTNWTRQQDPNRLRKEWDSPYNSIVKLWVINPDDTVGGCTGFSIERRVILTARHCLVGSEIILQDSTGMIYDEITSDQWIASDIDDIGVIVTNQAIPSGKSLQLGDFPDNVNNFTAGTAGFPGDKPVGTIWESSFDNFMYLFGYNRIIAGGVAFGGQSGSPLYDQRYIVRAVLTEVSSMETQEATVFFVPLTEELIHEINMKKELQKQLTE